MSKYSNFQAINHYFGSMPLSHPTFYICRLPELHSNVCFVCRTLQLCLPRGQTTSSLWSVLCSFLCFSMPWDCPRSTHSLCLTYVDGEPLSSHNSRPHPSSLVFCFPRVLCFRTAQNVIADFITWRKLSVCCRNEPKFSIPLVVGFSITHNCISLFFIFF